MTQLLRDRVEYEGNDRKRGVSDQGFGAVSMLAAIEGRNYLSSDANFMGCSKGG
jgi:hypothetical protein